MLLVLSPKRKRVSPIFALIHLLPHHDTRIGGGVYVLEIPSIWGFEKVVCMQCNFIVTVLNSQMWCWR